MVTLGESAPALHATLPLMVLSPDLSRDASVSGL